VLFMNKYVFKKKRLIFLITIFDFFGSLFAWPLKFLYSKKKPETISRILLIRLDHMGDVIMSTVVLRPLREAFPQARIDFLVADWAYDLLKNNPYLDTVTPFKPVWFDRERYPSLWTQLKDLRALIKIIKKGDYEAVVDLKGDLRQIIALFLAGVTYRISYGITGGGFLLWHNPEYRRGGHETDHNLDLVKVLGVVTQKAKLDLFVSVAAEETAEKILKGNGIQERFVVLHVLSGHTQKNWQNQKFSHLVRYLGVKKGLAVVLIGTDRDKKIVDDVIAEADIHAVNLCGKTDLETVAGVIKKASLFVGVDSGPAHIAAGCDVPAIILFSGKNDKHQWAPRGDLVRILYPGDGKDLSSIDSESVCRVVDNMLD
jgi:ADP-heptose:LPS heptosyltransferase